jgi:hypothetical protein
MSMAQTIARRGAGLGDAGSGIWSGIQIGMPGATGASRPRVVGNNPGSSNSSGSNIWEHLTPIIGAGLTVLNNWVVTRPGANPVAVAQLSNGQTFQQQLTPEQYQAWLASQRGGVGFGVDGQGIRLSDGSHISWVMIALVVGGFMLIQSRPFSRR